MAIARLEARDAEIVARHDPYGRGLSRIQTFIVTQRSACVRTARDEPYSWAPVQDYGDIGTVQSEVAWRGYARLVVEPLTLAQLRCGCGNA